MPSVQKEITCDEINKFFKSSSFNTLAVLKGTKPLGLVCKSSFDSKLSTMYGYSLYSKKPIESVIDSDTLIIDASTPIYDAGQMALQRTNEYDDIMVLDKGRYAGIVTMKSIIAYTIDYEKNAAKNLNPLTSLPGNTSISKTLGDIIHSKINCGVFYADIDNFKVYNDVYGFEAGDSIISLVASILRKIIIQRHPRTSFVGHIGGDDFVFIVEAAQKEYYLLCGQILSEFDEHFTANDRNGVIRNFPLTSLTISGVYGHLFRFKSESDIAKACAYIKGEAKKMQGSNYLLSEVVSEQEARTKIS